MKKYLLAIVTFFTVTISFAQTLEQNKYESTINFKIKNLGTYAKGTFSESIITGNFNPADLENSSLNATIQVRSVDTNIKKRDKHLLEEDYFDAATYPTIRFSSTKVERKSDTNYVLYGKLSIKKTSKEVKLPLVVKNSGAILFVSSDFTLSRKEYGVGGRSWILSDKIKAQVQFTVKKE